jgi:Flp pilus assembly protein TadG
MGNWLRTIGRDERGGIAVEFGLSLPFVALLFVGMVDFGRAFYTQIELNSAARAALQYGLTDTTNTSQMTTIVRNSMNDSTVSVTAVASCTCPDGTVVTCGDPNAKTTCGIAPWEYLKVTAGKSLNLFFRYPGVPSPLPLSGDAVARYR